jgi:hypothetical protein
MRDGAEPWGRGTISSLEPDHQTGELQPKVLHANGFSYSWDEVRHADLSGAAPAGAPASVVSALRLPAGEGESYL